MNTTAKRITLTSQRECLSHKTNSAFSVIYVLKHCLDTCVRRVGWTFRRNGANNISSKWFFSWLVQTHSISSSCLTCDLTSIHLPYCHSGTGPACYFLLPYNKFQIFIFVLLKSLLFLASWFPVLYCCFSPTPSTSVYQKLTQLCKSMLGKGMHYSDPSDILLRKK